MPVLHRTPPIASRRRYVTAGKLVNLGRHDEIILMQSINLLGLQRYRGLAPAKSNIRVVTFGLSELTDPFDESERLAKVAELKVPIDSVSVVEQFPAGRLGQESLRLCARERWHSALARRARLAHKFGRHIQSPPLTTMPDLAIG